MKTLAAAAFLLVACAGFAHADIQGEAIDYAHGELKLQGWAAYDDAQEGKLPGVLLVHAWRGHGENVRAYVTIRPGQPRPTAADLIAHARERVGYKAPEEIVFLEEMPLNPTGKIDRTGLLEMAEDHLHPHGLE